MSVAMVSPVKITFRLVRASLVHVGLGDHERAERVVLKVDARAVLAVLGVGVGKGRVGVVGEASGTVFVRLYLFVPMRSD